MPQSLFDLEQRRELIAQRLAELELAFNGVRRVHTKHPPRERSEVTPLTRLPDFNSSISTSVAKGWRIEYRRSRTPDSLARLPLSDSMQVSFRIANSGTRGSGL